MAAQSGSWPGLNAAQAVQAVESVCDRVLRDPRDDMSRALLLEALAKFSTVPLASFPTAALDLVQLSRAQSDALSNRILASNSLADPSIDDEMRAVCHTVASVAAALKDPLQADVR